MDRLVNATPHPLHIHREDGTVLTLPKPDYGPVPRVDTTRLGKAEGPEGVTVETTRYGRVLDMPSREDGVVWVVSLAVASHPDAAGRDDFVTPGLQLRDDAGNIIGCKGLYRGIYDYR